MKLKIVTGLLNALIAMFLLCGTVDAAVLVFSADGSFVTKPSIAAANTAADVAGKTVRITSSTELTSNIQWRNDAKLIVDPSASILLNGYSFTGLSYVDPKWLGAKSNGIVNDASAIQDAVKSLASGGVLAFGAGSYLINKQISITTDGLTIDLGKATILNTIPIPKSTWVGQSINPIFLISASNTVVSGGIFKDVVSQGILAGGSFAGRGAQGNTKSGITFRNIRFMHLVSTIESKSIQTRHVDNVVLDNIVADNIGAARADHYCETLSINYGVRASITNSIVTNMNEGGAANFLYVDDGRISNSRFMGMRNPLYSVALGMHIKYSNRVVISDNMFELDNGGMAMKISEYSDDIRIINNTVKVTGPQSRMYAGIYFQGASKFEFANNVISYGGGRAIYVGPHTTVASRNGVITGNRISTNYNSGDSKVRGSGININGGNISQERLPIIVSNNHLYNADIYMFQTVNSAIAGNTLVTDSDFIVTSKSVTGRDVLPASTAIVVENGAYNTISKNTIRNNVVGPSVQRVGIRVLATTNSSVTDNEVFFASANQSYGYYDETSASTVFKDNKAVNAIVQHGRGNLPAARR